MDTTSHDLQRGDDYQAFLSQYYDNGWSIIPLEPAGKRPLVPWQPYQKVRPTAAQVQQWDSTFPRANWGIVTGSLSRLTVLDCDSEEAVNLAMSLGIPPTPGVKTAKGMHFYFQYAPGTRNFAKRPDLPGIDLRSEGGYVVAPPSMHPSGVLYDWVHSDEAVAPLPAWLIPADTRTVPAPTLTPESYDVVESGSRNDRLARLAGQWVKLGLTHAYAIAAMWNRVYCRPMLPANEVQRTVLSIWQTDQRNRPQFERIVITE